MGTTETKHTNVVIVLETNDRYFGIIAEAVSDIISIDCNGLQHPSGLRSKDGSHPIEGVFWAEDHLINFVSSEAIL